MALFSDAASSGCGYVWRLSATAMCEEYGEYINGKVQENIGLCYHIVGFF